MEGTSKTLGGPIAARCGVHSQPRETERPLSAQQRLSAAIEGHQEAVAEMVLGKAVRARLSRRRHFNGDTMMKPDAVHEHRSNDALCLSVEQYGNGEVRVIFDAVTLEESSHPRWRQEAFITNVTMGEDQLRGMKFSDEDLAEFGRTVLGSLAVHIQRTA